MTEPNKELAAMLLGGQTIVHFTKVDGTAREMRCTTNPGFFPSLPESKKERTVNEDVSVVWDLDVDGWRSFRNDSVNDFYINF